MAEDFTPVDDKKLAREKKKAEREAAKAAKQADRERKKASKASSPGSDAGIVTRFRNWLMDSYNGLFKIVIQPQLPKGRMALLLVASFVVGLLWAYLLSPVSFYDASPHQLSGGQRDQYIILVAGAHQAELYDDAATITLLQRVEKPGEAVRRLTAAANGEQRQVALQNIQDLADQAGPGKSAPSAGNIISSILQFIIAVVIFFIVINIFALLWGLLIGGYVDRFLASLRPKTEADIAAAGVTDAIRRRKELQAKLEETSKQEAATSSLGAPLLNRVSPYQKGRAFDDSFAIEDANDMFLGECGATIAKTIGDSNELTAIEIWLFDKDDFVRTLSKLLVSQHAFNDPVIRSELENRVDDPASDMVIIQPGADIILETKALRMQAKIIDLKPGTNPDLPPNSHFDELTIQMQAWQLQAGASAPAVAAAPTPMPKPAAPSGLPDLSSYEVGPPPPMPAGMPKPAAPSGLPDLSSYEVGPPPPMPAGMQPPPAPAPYNPAPTQPSPRVAAPPLGGLSPLSSPPLQTDDDDDDPFGGTGDFTPIGN